MVKSEDVKAKANEAIREIHRKVCRLEELAKKAPQLAKEEMNEERRLYVEIYDRLQVLEDIITELLEDKE